MLIIFIHWKKTTVNRWLFNLHSLTLFIYHKIEWFLLNDFICWDVHSNIIDYDMKRSKEASAYSCNCNSIQQISSIFINSHTYLKSVSFYFSSHHLIVLMLIVSKKYILISCVLFLFWTEWKFMHVDELKSGFLLNVGKFCGSSLRSYYDELDYIYECMIRLKIQKLRSKCFFDFACSI
jgi:hypothetical protein